MDAKQIVQSAKDESYDSDVLVVDCSSINSSCEVINLSDLQPISKNISPGVNTKKKQKQAKPKRKIIMDTSKSGLFAYDQDVQLVCELTNIKCVINNCERGLDKSKSKKLTTKSSTSMSVGKQKESPKNQIPKTPKKSISLPVVEDHMTNRIRPCCFRCKCISDVSRKEKLKRKLQAKKKTNWTTAASKIKHKQSISSGNQKKELPNKRKIQTTCSRQQKQPKSSGNQKKERTNKAKIHTSCSKEHKKTIKNKDYLRELSPISLSPLSDFVNSHDISYEDISLDSFTTQSEDDLDTLIKRTKERDKSMKYRDTHDRLFQHARYQTSTPYTAEFEFEKEECSTIYNEDMDVSVHSFSTVVMTPQIRTDVYSTTVSPIELVNPKRTSNECIKLSNFLRDCEIVTHPKLEAYSPSMSPESIVCLGYGQVEIKKEIKDEIQLATDVYRGNNYYNEDKYNKVNKEPPSPSPFIYNDYECNGKTIGIKKEKDSNYNDVPSNSMQCPQIIISNVKSKYS